MEVAQPLMEMLYAIWLVVAILARLVEVPTG
jgi:hypothetical protein